MYNNGFSGGTSSPFFSNCSFSNSNADRDGGAVYNNGFDGTSSPSFTNCSFSNSNAGDDGGAVYNDGQNGTSSPAFSNCILWGNTADEDGPVFYNNNASVSISHSIVDESDCSSLSANSNGNVICNGGMIFDQDPLFLDAANGDLRLPFCSPAIDAGDDNANTPTDDLDGNPRKYESIPAGNMIDMGAYEYQGGQITGNIVHVDSSATGNNDGSDWTNAFTDLQDAITAANACELDIIWVAEGTYLPTQEADGTNDSQRDFTFFLDFDIEIYGGFPNTGDPGITDRDWEAYPTILSGDFDGDDIPVTDMEDSDFPAENNGENAYTIVHTKNVSSAFIMDGFMINGGNANVSDNNAIPKGRGGAWYNDGSGTGNVSSPTIANCSFSNSNAGIGGGAVYNFGLNGTSSPSFSNCSFSYSNAGLDGGAVYNAGFNGTSSPSFTNCSFSNSNADRDGGAVFNNGTGGGTSSPSFSNCSFSNSNAGEDGGAVYNDGQNGTSSPSFTNCILWGNTATNGPVFYNEEASVTISHSLVDVQDCNALKIGQGSNNVTCSGNMLFDQDPLFVDAANGDLRLMECSPAIDHGDDDSVPTGITTDLDGNDRFYDAATNITAEVDMGAYEYQTELPDPTANCPASQIEIVLDPDMATLTAAEVNDNSTGGCGGLTFLINGQPSLDFGCENVGTLQNVTLQATDVFMNTGSCTATVRVLDNIAPTAKCPASIPDVELDINGNGTLPANIGNGESTDNCSVEETSPAMNFTCSDIGMKTVTLTASDGTNSVTEVCTFHVVDNIAPTAKCPASIPDVELDINCNGTLPANIGGGLSTDNCSVVETSPSVQVDCDDRGQQPVILTASDGTNSVEVTCYFNVVDNINPCCPPDHVLFVDANTLNDNDGSDWDNALKDLQRALEMSARCGNVTEIWVADGHYHPDQGPGQTPGDRTASFVMQSGIAIYGGFKGGEISLSDRDWTVNETFLDGDIGTPGNHADNSYHVINNDGGGINATAVLDGFIIKNGNADGVGDGAKGGGLFNENASPTLVHCTFMENRAAFSGGAVYNRSSAALIDSCTFVGNSAQSGGAISNSTNATSVISHCVFENNTATNSGGGIYNNSALLCGIYNSYFIGNTADNNGGGIQNLNSSPDIINCVFRENEADEGGAITNQAVSSPLVLNCSFHANHANMYGEAIRNHTGTIPLITNCIVWGNTAASAGDEISNAVPGPIIAYSIVKQATGVYPGFQEQKKNAQKSRVE